MRAVALLVVASCTTTTTTTVRGSELYHRLDELRTTGRADVATETIVNDAKTGEPGLATVTLDTKLVHQYKSGSVLAFSDGCVHRDAEGEPIVKLDGCYFGLYAKDRFVLREESRFEPGLALKTTGALLGFAAYGFMNYCIWNCEDETYANISLVGVGIVSAVAVAVAIGKASD